MKPIGFNERSIVFTVCILHISTAIPADSILVLHSRILQLRGGGKRHLIDTVHAQKYTEQPNETKASSHNISSFEYNGSFANGTSCCSIRREQNESTILPGASRRAQMAHKAGPPARSSLKRTVMHFLWTLSDWLGVTGTSTRIVSELD